MLVYEAIHNQKLLNLRAWTADDAGANPPYASLYRLL
jgi:hypothetical protein